MGKITCDICGTTYAQTAPCCPICGNSRNYGDSVEMEDLIRNGDEDAGYSNRRREIFDFDEVNADTYEDVQSPFGDVTEQEPSGPNTFVIILLTALIASMLIAAGFIFARYYLPNRGGEPTIPVATVETTELPVEETTEPLVPCTDLVMSSGANAQLSAQGQHFLLHVQAKPENTTDTIIYTSADESIATVTEDGRITAVSEGETTVYIACGTRTLECPVIVKYVEDTLPPEIDITPPSQVVAEDVPQEQTEPEETEPKETEDSKAETESSSPANTDVVLKLAQTDIRLEAYLGTTLKLDCDLKPEQVEWSSEHPYILTVDEKGFVQSKGPGTTVVTAKYGDQTVECIVRCIVTKKPEAPQE